MGIEIKYTLTDKYGPNYDPKAYGRLELHGLDTICFNHIKHKHGINLHPIRILYIIHLV